MPTNNPNNFLKAQRLNIFFLVLMQCDNFYKISKQINCNFPLNLYFFVKRVKKKQSAKRKRLVFIFKTLPKQSICISLIKKNVAETYDTFQADRASTNQFTTYLDTKNLSFPLMSVDCDRGKIESSVCEDHILLDNDILIYKHIPNPNGASTYQFTNLPNK